MQLKCQKFQMKYIKGGAADTGGTCVAREPDNTHSGSENLWRKPILRRGLCLLLPTWQKRPASLGAARPENTVVMTTNPTAVQIFHVL